MDVVLIYPKLTVHFRVVETLQCSAVHWDVLTAKVAPKGNGFLQSERAESLPAPAQTCHHSTCPHTRFKRESKRCWREWVSPATIGERWELVCASSASWCNPIKTRHHTTCPKTRFKRKTKKYWYDSIHFAPTPDSDYYCKNIFWKSRGPH